ncbi:MAG: AAA family ATPase [Candidatus Poribacteria bacterium]|nr:AAA family ATPase [Candidatus Poribacteria bacterium]
MNNYFIESLKIKNLWGYRDIARTFHKDVNILIGPNGSGKTTILNLLHSILSGDLRSISNVNFEQVKIRLRSFKGRSIRTIRVDIADGFLKLKVGQKEHKIHTDILSDRRSIQRPLFYLHERSNVVRNMLSEEIDGELTALVPLVWLPVSRRLPVTEYEEERHTRTEPLESVDLRLEKLLDALSRYHSGLNALLSKRYKDFEREVLSVILYSKDRDKLNSISFSSPAKAKIEKKQLLGAFEAAGLLDEQMQNRIDEHFAAVEEVVKRSPKGKNVYLESEDIFVLPLIGRTQDMVKYAGELEEDREHIFALLRHYEEAVNSFLDDKSVEVDDSGDLKIKSSAGSNLDWHFLSSGEKQILILLTEALLRVNKPVVYIADEPELSLHIKWQVRLLESLMSLDKSLKPAGEKMQIIVATHSPDIVGNFQDKVIDLGRAS